jgi:hypothetical protein
VNFQIPPPKTIHVAIPTIRLPIDIPFVGCTGGSAKTYVGKQLGNLPDLATMLHIRTILKALQEQIYALIQGELPDVLRAPVYAARAAQLIAQVASIISTINDVITRVLAEVNAAITFANQKIAELQTLANQFASIPESALTLAQQLMMQRYQEYTGELNAQIGRLQSTLGCLVGL